MVIQRLPEIRKPFVPPLSVTEPPSAAVNLTGAPDFPESGTRTVS
jgi:hypothetical protein